LKNKLGIETRHVAAPHEHIADLAAGSLSSALGRAGWVGNQLGAVVCATSFVDDVLPATASMISRDISPTAVAFDVNAACASVPYAVATAQGLMLTQPDLDRVAVCAAERPTAWADYQDRESSVFWGDSAGTLLLRRGGASGFRLVDVALLNDNAHPERVRVRHHGAFHHDGRYSFDQVLTLSDKVTQRVLARAGLKSSDLRAFVGHQSNPRLLVALGERLNIPWHAQWHNVSWAGNQAGAGVLTAFSLGWHQHGADLRPGDHVLLAAVGGGYSAGAILLEWLG